MCGQWEWDSIDRSFHYSNRAGQVVAAELMAANGLIPTLPQLPMP